MTGLGGKKALVGLGLLGALGLSACASRPTPASRVAGTPGPACGDVSFPLYFQPGSDQMTAEQGQVIAAAAERVKGCALGPLDVVGLAGSLEGPREEALALARRRSIVVADALKTVGLPAPRFDLDAVGSEGALTKGGKRVPLRRRAEVVIHAGNPVTASK